ncbi:MAG TPA: M20/M25/M40 family metallo-hydrolase [Chloroflexaceae bacterium]|mgnify:CR=1 FL=1|nr:M20/M25/M40 family metallo-hydrolase [Chloroflexaceae bacterium]
MPSSTLDPARTIAELKELRALTGDADGAQRVAWTDTWARARAWMAAKLAELPVAVETDQAGNVWATLRGESERALLIGGHIDSVPNGGWLDGCLNLLAGLEVLRRLAAEGAPPVTVRLVDWAEEAAPASGAASSARAPSRATWTPRSWPS